VQKCVFPVPAINLAKSSELLRKVETQLKTNHYHGFTQKIRRCRGQQDLGGEVENGSKEHQD